MPRNKVALLIVFLLLLAAAAYLRFFRQQKETLKPIFTADSLAVGRIEIADSRDTLTLAKVLGHWQIASPTQWGVEEGRLQMFFKEVVLERYATTPLGTGKTALEQYQLLKPEQVLRIKVFSPQNKLLREVWFSNPGNPFDYFRFAGDGQVYQIRRKVARFYGPQFESWRSPHVLRLFSEQMLSIKVRHSKNSYTLTRNGEIWHYQDKLEDFDIPAGNQTMGKLLNILANLGSYAILSEEEKPDPQTLPEPACEAVILKTDRDSLQIKFYPYGEHYLMTVSTHPDMYFVVIFDTVFRFTRHALLFRAREGYPPQ